MDVRAVEIVVRVVMKRPGPVHQGLRRGNSGVDRDSARNDAQGGRRERHQEISVGRTSRCSARGGSVCRRTVERDRRAGDIASRGGIVPCRNGEGNDFPAHDGGLVLQKTDIELVPGTPSW